LYFYSSFLVCQWLAEGRWLSPGTPVSSTSTTDRHDITEILLKVVLNTIPLNLRSTSIHKNILGNRILFSSTLYPSGSVRSGLTLFVNYSTPTIKHYFWIGARQYWVDICHVILEFISVLLCYKILVKMFSYSLI
jgi:hypothetical protein